MRTRNICKKILLALCLCTLCFGAACNPSSEKQSSSVSSNSSSGSSNTESSSESGENSGTEGEEVKGFAYYPQKTNIKTDGQALEKEGIVFPSSLWETPVSERYETLDRGEIKGYFISSVNNTQVFCYVGIPQTASAENKVPAVVLVHGGSGTAFYDWVEAWVQRGYAAIAMDTEGHMPAIDCSTQNATITTSVKPHGPSNPAFQDATAPVEEQWTYNAVASVIASTSFIRSFEEVDGAKIGITGVSYGSFLTCIATAYDDRYSFAAPVYGSLSNGSANRQFAGYLKNGNGNAIALWDNVSILQNNRTPFLFVSGISDVHFAPDSITRTAEVCKYARVTWLPNFLHAHYEGSRTEEVFRFAEEIFYQKNALLRLKGSVKQGVIEVELPEGVEVQKAELCYTSKQTVYANTVWTEIAVQRAGNFLYFDVTESLTHGYVRVQDSKGHYVCTSFV